MTEFAVFMLGVIIGGVITLALKLAVSAHGKSLLSDPPQDMWKFRNVSAIAEKALAQFRALKEKSE